MNMHTYTALHTMLTRQSVRCCQRVWTFCSLSHMISMLPPWSLDQTRLASTTSSNLEFGASVKNQKMIAHGWMTVSNCFPRNHIVTLTCVTVERVHWPTLLE